MDLERNPSILPPRVGRFDVPAAARSQLGEECEREHAPAVELQHSEVVCRHASEEVCADEFS